MIGCVDAPLFLVASKYLFFFGEEGGFGFFCGGRSNCFGFFALGFWVFFWDLGRVV